MSNQDKLAIHHGTYSHLIILRGPFVIFAEPIDRKQAALIIHESSVKFQNKENQLTDQLKILILTSGKKGYIGISRPTARCSLSAFRMAEGGTPTITLPCA